MVAASAPPVHPSDPSQDAELSRLWQNVRDALYSLPSYFESTLAVSGVLATDLFTFNASLGATIESQVVAQLNRLRGVWDPDEEYSLYRFERQPQRFPDVILRTTAPGLDPRPLMGIELKGWYVLAKEREPSFRYVVTPAVSTDYDLLLVFPWALSEVVSGSPVLFRPWVEQARFAAEYRNWHWQHKRVTSREPRVTVSQVISNYPTKSELISDRAVADNGGNFGRIARTDLMDDYVVELFKETLSGIPIDAWQRFFRVFSQDGPKDRLDKLMEQLNTQYQDATIRQSGADPAVVVEKLRDLLQSALALE